MKCDRARQILLNGKTFNAIEAVDFEISRARAKHPTNQHLLAALVEEVGELAKELLDNGNSEHAKTEAMHVACVAIRIMTEGDSDFGGAA